MDDTQRIIIKKQWKEPELSNGGVSVLDNHISVAHKLVTDIQVLLAGIDQRLYAPRAVNIGENPVPVTGSVEGELVYLIARLREIERQATIILG